MKIYMHTEEDLEFSEFSEATFELVASSSDQHYSALQMFATSLALCTYSVLAEYGDTIDTDTGELSIRVRWEYEQSPFRVGMIDMAVTWPGVPKSRLEAARRAATHCTLHHTLERPPRVITTVN